MFNSKGKGSENEWYKYVEDESTIIYCPEDKIYEYWLKYDGCSNYSAAGAWAFGVFVKSVFPQLPDDRSKWYANIENEYTIGWRNSFGLDNHPGKYVPYIVKLLKVKLE